MREENLDRIAAAAVEAMLYEVSATPKPGLVDRSNCGAHRDMDFFTFMTSAASLRNYFDRMVCIGQKQSSYPVRELLAPLRKCGREAEEDMFRYTGGVNTHKGMLFSLGLLAGCAGWRLGKGALSPKILCDLTAEMCRGICARELAGIKRKKILTNGEKIYARYGRTGVRGEVESGYATVRKYSLPVYEALRDQQIPVNEALVQTLLYLMAGTADTNILSRHDMKTAEYVRKCASTAIEKGGIFSEEGKKHVLWMDEEFIRRNISPGGCADLLAVTHFLYTLKAIKF